MKQFLLNVYAKLRGILNPIKLSKEHEEWDRYMNMKMMEFSSTINSFPYKSDKLGGLVDRTESFEHFIDVNVKSDRDCDDYARMWSFWGISNGYKIYEVIVTTRKHLFKDSHVVTILANAKGFAMMNYKPYKNGFAFKSLEEAVEITLPLWNDCYKEGLIYSISIKG